MQSLPMWTSRLEGVEVLDKVLAWIMEWLTWRRQKVVLNGEKSERGVGGNDLMVAAVGRKGHMKTWWPASRFEVIKAAFSLMLTVQFHPFFNIIHLVANQIRHRFIEEISNTFFQIVFAALEVGQSDGWNLVVLPKLYLKNYEDQVWDRCRNLQRDQWGGILMRMAGSLKYEQWTSRAQQ